VHPLRGITLKLLATLAFTTMSAAIKELTLLNYPTGQMVFCRSIFALLPLMFWLGFRGEIGGMYRTRHIGRHVIRAVIGGGSMFCYFAALAYIALPDATAIGYTVPLITVVLAALVLKEKVRAYRWSAVGVGFIGVIIMLSPYVAGGTLAAGGSGAGLGVALALANCVLAATAMVQVRQMIMEGESSGAIVFYFQLLVSVFSLTTLMIGGWKIPDLYGAILLFSIGILGGIGQILLVASYRHADASLLAPFDYTSMIWALIFGYALFGEVPLTAVLVGAAIVIASGLFVILREHHLVRTARSKAKTQQPALLP
jgi:drug/metabolite transporter (DMT)-like permease